MYSGKDLIVMAGNLLDNAIEAARQCVHGSVHAALYAQEHFLVMEVENTCINTQIANNGENISCRFPRNQMPGIMVLEL